MYMFPRDQVVTMKHPTLAVLPSMPRYAVGRFVKLFHLEIHKNVGSKKLDWVAWG